MNAFEGMTNGDAEGFIAALDEALAEKGIEVPAGTGSERLWSLDLNVYERELLTMILGDFLEESEDEWDRDVAAGLLANVRMLGM